MTTHIHPGPLEHAPAARSATPAASWREKRWERRRRRIRFERMVAWVVVPLILLGVYWAADAILTAMGTSPGDVLGNLAALLRGR